jgi:hypothetical protein
MLAWGQAAVSSVLAPAAGEPRGGSAGPKFNFGGSQPAVVPPAPAPGSPAQPVFVFGAGGAAGPAVMAQAPAPAPDPDVATSSFELLVFHLGPKDLAVAARVSKAWRDLVENDLSWTRMLKHGGERFGLMLCSDICGNRPLWPVAARYCLRAKDEVKLLWNLCHFPARFPAPARPPPRRPPAKKDRIGYIKQGSKSGGFMGMMGNGNEWMDVVNCQPSIFAPGGGESRRRLANYFADAPHHWSDPRFADSGSCVMCLSSLVKMMNELCQRKDPGGCRVMLGAGLGPAMIQVLQRQTDRDWLQGDQHEFCIFYAVSSLGSALHAQLDSQYSKELVERGLLDVLLPLLAGSVSWLEARLAMRCLGHLLLLPGPHTAWVGEQVVNAGAVPVIAHYLENVLPVCVRENICKPARAAHWHHDILLKMRESGLRYARSSQIAYHFLSPWSDTLVRIHADGSS